jgi:hypothetical protein
VKTRVRAVALVTDGGCDELERAAFAQHGSSDAEAPVGEVIEGRYADLAKVSGEAGARHAGVLSGCSSDQEVSGCLCMTSMALLRRGSLRPSKTPESTRRAFMAERKRSTRTYFRAPQEGETPISEFYSYLK